MISSPELVGYCGVVTPRPAGIAGTTMTGWRRRSSQWSAECRRLPPLGGLAALASAPVEEDLDGPMAEESDTGPEEEL